MNGKPPPWKGGDVLRHRRTGELAHYKGNGGWIRGGELCEVDKAGLHPTGKHADEWVVVYPMDGDENTGEDTWDRADVEHVGSMEDWAQWRKTGTAG